MPHPRSSVRHDGHAALPDPTTPFVLDPFEPVIGRFLAIATEHARRPAVVLGPTTWTYGRLRTAVLGLAHELEQLGLRPGDAVAVTGTKCPGLITAILAVLARNAVLVPVDPALPGPRRREMVQRSGARVLIEAGDPQGIEPMDLHGLDVRRFTLPAVPEITGRVRGAARDGTPASIGGDDPAYVLFTSGTTGAPKGIVGRQRGLSHFLAWEREVTGVGPGDRSGQLTGLSFDVVLRDLLLPLTSGAALHLPPFAPGATPPSELFAFLARDRITLIHAVPTIAAFWLSDVPEAVQLPDLRWVLFAGEPLPGALVRRWRERFGTERIGNLYGPTETTLAKCFAEIGPDPEPGIQPIGRTIPGAQALVLDGDRRCEAGELGEIVIRTPYRSLGYLDGSGDPRPPFVQNPFTDDPSDLVYRTGDQGRYRPDGTLEIHGRLDDQVKILGVRIEPSEIAAELTTHPDVRAATVVARPDPHGDPALIAYVVPERPGVDDAALRAYLADRLMAAKVPRLIVELPELPRTANGKIDRAALPEPSWTGSGNLRAVDPADAGPAVSPMQAVADEQATAEVVAIFRELLGNPDVGPDDDFFRSGGHSLLAARLIERFQARLGVRIQVRSLFLHPTARGLASLAGAAPVQAGLKAPAVVGARVEAPTAPIPSVVPARATIPDAVVPIQPGGTAPPLFVVPGVGSRILYLRHLARLLGPDQPLYALHARHLDDGSPYERVEDLAAVYVRAIRAVQPTGPYRLLGFSFGGLVALEVAQQLRASGLAVAFVGVVDTRLPDLRRHKPWSIARSIPRRLLNQAAILQPLAGPARRGYLRSRLLIARQNGWAQVVQWLHRRLPAPLARLAPDHPYGPDEIEWLELDRRASRRYEPRPFPGAITYFWAAHSQRPPDVEDHREGWDRLALGGLDVRPIPGSHLTVMIEPLVRSTATAIRGAMDDTSEGDGRPRQSATLRAAS